MTGEITTELTTVQPLSLGIGILQTLKDVAKVGDSQFSIRFPLQAGSATGIAGVGHGSTAGPTLWNREITTPNPTANPLMEL